jgi:hypothetical protein
MQLGGQIFQRFDTSLLRMGPFTSDRRQITTLQYLASWTATTCTALPPIFNLHFDSSILWTTYLDSKEKKQPSQTWSMLTLAQDTESEELFLPFSI